MPESQPPPKKKKKPLATKGVSGPKPAAPAKPVRKSSEQMEREEREALASQYKADGYNASVVTRKMITQHGMSEPDAEALVGRIFGRKVSARTGDTTVAVASGIGMSIAAFITLVLMFWYIPITPGWLWLVYAALVGLIGKGLSQAFIALVNVNSKEELVKKD